MASKYREEIELIYKVITHPAGFNVDLFGDHVSIQGNDQGTYEVSWRTNGHALACPFRSFTNPLKAAVFFVLTRHRLKYGVDYDAQACKETGH